MAAAIRAILPAIIRREDRSAEDIAEVEDILGGGNCQLPVGSYQLFSCSVGSFFVLSVI